MTPRRSLTLAAYSRTTVIVLLSSFAALILPPDSASADKPAVTLRWQRIPGIPDRHGVAAPFAGLHGSTLLVGGGANFPDRMPWDGGGKVWYDRIWLLDQGDDGWRTVGELPRPLGYGVSISTREGLICIGGSDAERHYSDVFRLAVRDRKLELTPLPPLPRPIANACGAMIGRTIYVAGGLESPKATATLKSFLALDLAESNPRWKELEAWPGPPRMLAVAAVLDDCFYLVSGTDLVGSGVEAPTRRYLNDAYRFRPGAGWQPIANVSRPVVAAPSPAPVVGLSQFAIVGGDDGSNVGFQPQQKHPGFSNCVLVYDSSADQWSEAGTTPAPRVTAPTVKWGDLWLIISGEQRPGVRSPEVWGMSFADH